MKYKIINRRKRIATILADIAAKILFAPITLFRKHPALDENIREILVIRTAYVGDVLMTLPILKPLRLKFPAARISFLTCAAGAELLRNNRLVDRVFTYNAFWFFKSGISDYLALIRKLRKERFDLVIEARGDIRDILLLAYPIKARFRLSYGFGGGAYLLTHVAPFTAIKHRVEYHMDLVRSIGCPVEGALEWGITLTPAEEQSVAELLAAHGLKSPFVAAHPGTRLRLKRWPPDRCAELYDEIIAKTGMPLAILGSEDERELVESVIKLMKRKPVNLAGALSIRQLAGALARAAIFVCNDSAPMHIAAAMNTPTVAIFGPSKPEETAPYSRNSRAVKADVPCRWTCDEQVCRQPVHNQCMQQIQPGDVFRAFEEVLKESLYVQPVNYS